jgi:cell division septation protein DedD
MSGMFPAHTLTSALRRKDENMIRKLKSGEYRLYSRKTNPKTGKRRNLGTFASRAAAEKHEREVQYFKRH